jgi:hypothetical protein
MLEGSLIIEGAAWRVRCALRLMELDESLDIEIASRPFYGLRAARDVLAYFSSPVPPAPQTRVAPALIAELSLRYGPRPERSTGVDGGIVQSDRLFRHTRR